MEPFMMGALVPIPNSSLVELRDQPNLKFVRTHKRARNVWCKRAPWMERNQGLYQTSSKDQTPSISIISEGIRISIEEQYADHYVCWEEIVTN